MNTARGRAALRLAVVLLCSIAAGGLIVLVSLPAAASVGREVVINLPEFRLYVYENGTRTRDYPIAIGSVVEQETVLGTTRIINRVADPTYYPRDWWLRDGVEPIPPGPDNPVGTRWLGLDIPHYGIHGTNRPETIGSPASAGCIRMYNEDVEELTELVRVGTAVHILYETVLVERDPLKEQWRIRIHPDLYDRGTNRLEAVLKRLKESGVNPYELSRSGLQALVEEAGGEARPLPFPHRVLVNGHLTGIDAFRIGDQVYVHAEALAELVGETARWSPTWGVGVVAGQTIRTGLVARGELYAPPADIAQALGIEWEAGEEAIDFGMMEVWLDGERLFVSAFREHDWVLLPLEPLASLVGQEVGWDPVRYAAVLNGTYVFGVQRKRGRTYLPHDRLERLLPFQVARLPDAGAREAAVRLRTVDDERAIPGAGGL